MGTKAFKILKDWRLYIGGKWNSHLLKLSFVMFRVQPSALFPYLSTVRERYAAWLLKMSLTITLWCMFRLSAFKVLYIQSLILSGKNILQELLSRELTTMRNISLIKNLDNFDAYLYSDRQSSNFYHWNSEQFKFTSKWIVHSKIDRIQQL